MALSRSLKMRAAPIARPLAWRDESHATSSRGRAVSVSVHLLLALEDRVSPAHPGHDALHSVFAPEKLQLSFAFAKERIFERSATRVKSLLDGRECHWRTRLERARHRERSVSQPKRGHDVQGEAEFLHPGRVDLLGHEDHLHRSGGADEAREPERTASVGHETDLHEALLYICG